MGKINLKKRLAQAKEEKLTEKTLQQACRAFKNGKFKSIRQTAEAFGVHYSTLNRRLKGI